MKKLKLFFTSPRKSKRFSIGAIHFEISPRNSIKCPELGLSQSLPTPRTPRVDFINNPTVTIDPECLFLDSTGLLGSGRFGIVVRGEYEGNQVAVKVLPFERMDKELVNNEINALV